MGESIPAAVEVWVTLTSAELYLALCNLPTETFSTAPDVLRAALRLGYVKGASRPGMGQDVPTWLERLAAEVPQ